MAENNKAETMTVKILQKCLKSMENDHVKLIKEGDNAIQRLSKEKHQKIL